METYPSFPNMHSGSCPQWCVTTHVGHEPSQVHSGHAHYVPAIIDVTVDNEPESLPVITDVVVIRHMRTGGQHDWLYIGEAGQHRQQLRLSVESARRLAQTIDESTHD